MKTVKTIMKRCTIPPLAEFPRFGGWFCFGLFCIIALFPVLLMLGKSVVGEAGIGLGHYRTLLTDPRIFSLLVRSCGLALGATLLSIAFGLPLAICLARTSFLGKRFCALIYCIPLFIPPHVHALAWISLLGTKGLLQSFISTLTGITAPLDIYTPGGATVILFLAYFPLLVITVTTGLLQIDNKLEEAASFSASKWRTLCHITLPLAAPYLLAGAVFVFIFSLFNYGVPSMLRVPTFPVEIFTRFSAYYDEAGASALALPPIIIAVCLLLVQKKYLNDRSCIAISGRSTLTGSTWTNTGKWAAFFVWSFLVLAVIAPILALIVQAGSWQNLHLAWHSSQREIIVSLLVATGSATLATILAYLIAVHIGRLSSLGQYLVDIGSLLPFGFPAVIFGIGLIHLWNNQYTGFIYTTALIMVFTYLARFVPFGIRILLANLTQISPSLHEAALLCEQGRIKRLLRIELPLAKRGLLLCWIIVFVFTMGELGATLLVIPPGLTTVSLKIYTLMHYGAGPLVAALALILVTINLAVSSTIFLAPKGLQTHTTNCYRE